MTSGNPVRLRFLDRRLRGPIEHEHADFVPAIQCERHAGLAEHFQRPARQFEVLAVRDIEYLGETGIFVAAQCGVDHMVRDDACLLATIANAAKRRFGEFSCVHDAQVDTARLHCVISTCAKFIGANDSRGLTPIIPRAIVDRSPRHGHRHSRAGEIRIRVPRRRERDPSRRAGQPRRHARGTSARRPRRRRAFGFQ